MKPLEHAVVEIARAREHLRAGNYSKAEAILAGVEYRLRKVQNCSLTIPQGVQS